MWPNGICDNCEQVYGPSNQLFVVFGLTFIHKQMSSNRHLLMVLCYSNVLQPCSSSVDIVLVDAQFS